MLNSYRMLRKVGNRILTPNDERQHDKTFTPKPLTPKVRTI